VGRLGGSPPGLFPWRGLSNRDPVLPQEELEALLAELLLLCLCAWCFLAPEDDEAADADSEAELWASTGAVTMPVISIRLRTGTNFLSIDISTTK
jgi:hypothetical protein